MTSSGSASFIRTLFCLDVKPEMMVILFLKSFWSSLVSSLLTFPLVGVSVQWIMSLFCSIVIWNCFDCGFMYRSRSVP